MTDKKNVERLLEQRNALRKPAFVVKESHFKAGVKKNWRRPRGKHSPVRQCHKGRIKMPHPGYGSPKAVYGLSKKGLLPVVVNTVSDLDKVDATKEAVVIASNVGLKKRLVLLKACKDKGLVLDTKDLAKEISKCDRKFADSKKLTNDRRVKKKNKEKSRAKATKKEDKKTSDKKEDNKKNNKEGSEENNKENKKKESNLEVNDNLKNLKQ